MYFFKKLKNPTKLLKFNLFKGLTLFIVLPNTGVLAQTEAITPDGTLPINSRVTPENKTLLIEGGTQVGGNLFHSFKEFSLPTELKAFFNNSSSVENIISRVTGKSISIIDGLIQTNGTANLFFLNPNGIVFGANASLDIGGSFIATTANSIKFADGTEFKATNPSNSSLLTLSIPIGLQFRENQGVISVQGSGHNLQAGEPLIFFSVERGEPEIGLQVKPGKTLALVGGAIELDGGTLKAEGGQIELGSVNTGKVSLNSTSEGWTFSYEGVEAFGNIQLRQRALVDASGLNSGSIKIQGAGISVTDSSVIWIENQGNQPGKNIDITASESLEISGVQPKFFQNFFNTVPSLIFTQAVGAGKGGDINISTKKLMIRGGANIGTLTLKDSPQGGTITVKAFDSLQVIGGFFISNIFARSQNSGNAGNVFVSTNKLTIANGAGIVSASSLGTGNAGNVQVNASSIELSGINQDAFALLPSSISSPTFTSGNAGNVEINTNRLILNNGSQINTSTGSSGNAGNITINATELIEIRGSGNNSINPTQIISSANFVGEQLQNLLGLPSLPTGASGNVTINTPKLIITNGAQATVRHDGTGSAGNLIINADSIFLDNQGGITASTISGQGGNITLNVRDKIYLRNKSLITATAEGTQDGGNININSPFILAFPNENSDIVANSFNGQGGAINISAQGVFGLSVRDRLTSDNDITAFSQLEPGLNGTVTLILPDSDPNRGIVKLSEITVDPNSLIVQTPCQTGRQNQFTVTGRGGLPPSVNEDLSTPAVEVGLVEPNSTPLTQWEPQQIPYPRSAKINKPVPAQGWVFNEKGEIVLTAYNPNITQPIGRLPQPPQRCSIPQVK